MAAGDRHLLVLNAGSSSIKFRLYRTDAGDTLDLNLKGQLEGVGSRPRLKAVNGTGHALADVALASSGAGDVAAALDRLDAWLRERLPEPPMAVGHRVVHGGPTFSEPVLVDAGVLERLEALSDLAPLHQPNNLAPIRALRARYPDLPQVACFDTAFHRGHPEVADRFAIPDSWYREGVRRYGFHGLSYEYVAGRLRELDPALARGRVVACHLGSGASMCAIQGGRSLDSTMSFTAADGLPMGTRTGQIDPGVLLYLMQAKGFDAERVERFVYHEGGLKGLSGVGNDVRDLLASDDPGAKRALDHFVYRIVREAGALASVMGGVDGVVFTAGIGENSPEVRGRVMEGLRWLGLEPDAAANARHGPLVSALGSKLKAYVIPTDEELTIARHALALLRA